MSEEIRRLVDERWEEYGIGEQAGEDGRPKASLRQLLRR
jgi:hypothetical protein